MSAVLGWLVEKPLVGVLVPVAVAAVVVTTALIADPSAESVQIRVMPADAALDLDNLAPGDSVRGQVTVSNSGTLPLRYSMVVVVETDRGNATSGMTLTVARRQDNADSCQPLVEELYSGPLALAMLGDPNPGDDPGDRVLTAGESEELCLVATFLPTNGNAQQGAAGRVKFSFFAEGPP